MASSKAPPLGRCTLGSCIALLLFGALGSLLAPNYDGGIPGFFAGGAGNLFLVHAFFIAAPAAQGGLLAAHGKGLAVAGFGG